VMVMRGDGGATDLEGFRAAPARTLYSGPAASVAGALRYARITDGIVVEVGGTSTNVASVRLGRPALSYVQVASHATALRSVDVRVVGVAGGSMLRVRRGRVLGVGPRSAHIAGLAYACFTPAEAFEGARFDLIAPKVGDPADYAVVRLVDGSAVALTNTCAANALGITRPGDYAWAEPAAARAAFAVTGAALRLDGDEVARRMLQASGEAVCELVDTLARARKLHDPVIVAVGGAAGGLGRHVAAMLGLECRVPAGAEVISSIGDALSHVRAEKERTVDVVSAAVVRELAAEVEAEALAAGVAPATLEVQVEEVPERGTVRAVATGSIGLRSGAVPGLEPCSEDEVRAVAGTPVQRAGAFWVAVDGDRVTVFDRLGEEVARLRGRPVAWGDLAGAVASATRYRGPVTLRPSVWVIDGIRLTELSSGDTVAAASALRDDDADQLVLVGRSR
ncbi:MAG: hydantoinase/oxoprolinase family protein, partial [Acidimicrobiales bacterium]